jgi:oligopeptide/dipeptide ABC transporter ATP-binding protein
MYLGHILESAPRKTIYTMPLHPYTRSLLSAVPVPDPVRQRQRTRIVLQGDVPSPIDPPSGCVFHTRCWLYERLGKPERCTTEEPPLRPFGDDHVVACHFAEELVGQPVGESAAETATEAATTIGAVDDDEETATPDVIAHSQESSAPQA